MKVLKFITIIIIFFFKFTFSTADEFKDEQNINISKNLRCLICQGQSVYDSQSDFALSVKNLIHQKLEEGLTETQIYEFLIEKYGEWIVYEPSVSKKTYILWFLPILLFLLGGVIIIKKINLEKNEKFF